MDLSIYDVIKDISISDKSRALFDKLGKITFEVHKDANKIMIRNAAEKIWNVKIKDIRVMNVKGKQKTFGRRIFQSPGKKKAIVTLKPGYKIDLPGQFESMGVAGSKEKAVATGAEGK
jgi:large subunit ribosomal protein L23